MKPINYLTLEEVLALHEISIKEFGGTHGIRELGLLESAVHQPQQSFGSQNLYVEIWDKAAILGYAISENQPFLDGNKRTAALSMLVFLEVNGYEVNVKKGEIYKTIMSIANKKITRKKIAQWLKKNVTRGRCRSRGII